MSPTQEAKWETFAGPQDGQVGHGRRAARGESAAITDAARTTSNRWQDLAL